MYINQDTIHDDYFSRNVLMSDGMIQYVKCSEALL